MSAARRAVREEDPVVVRLENGHYDRELAPLCHQVLALQPVAAIGTSGTIENLAAMCAALYDKGDKSDKGGSGEPGEEAQQRALAAPRGADQCHHFVLANGE
jgi:exopolyphosphatase/pppGpp-phosphohydrolase